MDEPIVSGQMLCAEIWYPRAARTDAFRFNAVQVALIDVRAADGIRIAYDFERDGWPITQCDHAEGNETWAEVAFVQAWGRESKEKP